MWAGYNTRVDEPLSGTLWKDYVCRVVIGDTAVTSSIDFVFRLGSLKVKSGTRAFKERDVNKNMFVQIITTKLVETEWPLGKQEQEPKIS